MGHPPPRWLPTHRPDRPGASRTTRGGSVCRRGRRLARPHRADDDGGLGSGDRRRSAVFAPPDAEGLSTRQATPRRAVPLSREPEAMWPRVFSVELRGFEPLTPTLPVSQSMSGWCGHVVGSLAHQHVSSGTSGACRGVVERLGPMVAHRPARCAATLTVSVGADWTTHAAPVLIGPFIGPFNGDCLVHPPSGQSEELHLAKCLTSS